MARSKTRNSTLSNVVVELRKKSLALLVMPHAGFFARHGVDLADDTIDANIWKIRIQNVLMHPSEPVPPALVEALTEVQAMATTAAHEAFLRLANKEGIALGTDAAMLTDIDLAALFYAQHHELFMSTFVKLETRSPSRFDVFYDLSRAPLHERLTPATLEKFKTAAREWWSVWRKRPAFTDLLIDDSDDVLALLIVHGDIARTNGIIDPKTFERSRVTFIPECHDTILFDKRTGRLSIHTQHKTDIKRYKTLFGEIFFGNPNQYREHRTYTTVPLIEDGAKALEADEAIDLISVYVKEMHLASADPKEELQLVVRSPKTSNLLTKSLESALMLGLDTVTYLRLGLKFSHSKKEFEIQLRPPITLSAPQAIADEVNQWLIARGFMVAPSEGTIQ